MPPRAALGFSPPSVFRAAWPALLVLLPLAIGCVTPSPIVRLHPRDPAAFWDAGREIVARTDTGVRVAVAFEHQSQTMLALRVEVANDTNARFDVQPHDVTYATCTADAASSCAPAQWAVDPETVLDALDIQHSRRTAEAQNAATVGTALTLLSVAADVGQIAHGHPERAQNTAVAAEVTASTSGVYAGAIGRIEDEQIRWTDAFRRTTLFPGQAMGGPVYIPIVPDAHLVWLQVKVGERKFLFCFSQETRAVLPEGATVAGRPGPAAPTM